MEVETEITTNLSNFVNTIWTDAQGNLSDLLTNNIQSYSLGDVARAEGILLQLKNNFNQKDENKELTFFLSCEFCKIIKLKTSGTFLGNLKDISRMFDLCQVNNKIAYIFLNIENMEKILKIAIISPVYVS